MKKVTFIFKSGERVQFNCEEIVVSRHSQTGELIGYSAKGIKSGRPTYSRVSSIDCIYTEEIEENYDLVYPPDIKE